MRKYLVLIVLCYSLFLKGSNVSLDLSENLSVDSLSTLDTLALNDSNKLKLRRQVHLKIKKDIVEFKEEPLASLRSLNSMEKWIIPSLALSYGLCARMEWLGVRQFDYYVRENVKSSFHHRYTFDNYLQYVPALSVFAFEPMGLKPRHNFKQRLALTAMAYAISGTTILISKTAFGVLRPDGSSHNSFPSGHTMMAMTGSHLSFQEYRHNSPWVAGMYVIGGTAAIMRSVNNRHWVSDVVTSVGVSILSVEAAYLLLPYVDEWLNLSTTTENGTTVAFVPMVNINSVGALLVIDF